MTRRRLRLLAAAALPLLLSGCGLPSFGAPDPASEQGAEVHDLYRWFTAAAVGVGVFVAGLIAYVLVRYRRRNDDVPNQNPYNVPVEIAYTAIPLLAVAVLFFFSVRTQLSVDDLDPEPQLEVEVIGFQWQWQFRYPESGVVVTGVPDTAPPELVLPVGQRVRFDLQTTDVIHNFWVPAFLQKRDMIPGIDNQIDVTPTRPGVYEGVCAEYCGLDHAAMRFTVRVVPAEEFDQWLAAQGTGSTEP